MRRSASILSILALSTVPHHAAASISKSSQPRSWSRRSERRGATTTVTPGVSFSALHIAGSWYTMLLPKPVGSVARQSRFCSTNARTASSCASRSDAFVPIRALSSASSSSLSPLISLFRADTRRDHGVVSAEQDRCSDGADDWPTVLGIRPEGYADRGDDGRERDGPQVRVVYRLLVHHLSVGLHAVRSAVVCGHSTSFSPHFQRGRAILLTICSFVTYLNTTF
mmetsp:Transcript_11538/g.53648  ORF Transcript_11538/g.53648 Transcript_11538/m.53648 type:complete len:225 (-) Transcript_11538:15-689(-)